MRASAIKSVIFVLWVTLFTVAVYYWRQSGVALTKVPAMMQVWLQDFGLLKAGLIYIVIYTFRPLIFFPATLLTIASGLIFGPWVGILFTIVGENFSANLAFFVARHLGRDFIKNIETGFIKKWDQRLKSNGVVTVMIMRFIYLPFDGVNYGCGLTAMRQRDYALGTFFGILPGLITFVLLGGTASVQVAGTINLLGVVISQRLFVLLLSVFFFVLGLVVAKMIRKFDNNYRLQITDYRL